MEIFFLVKAAGRGEAGVLAGMFEEIEAIALYKGIYGAMVVSVNRKFVYYNHVTSRAVLILQTRHQP